MLNELTEHVLIAAMHTTAAKGGIWDADPSPSLAQAAPNPGPAAKEVHEVLNMRAPLKAHAVVRPIQLVGLDTKDAPAATTELHVLKHRDCNSLLLTY